MRAALVQLTSSDDPAENLPITEAFVREAANAGATLILTPEVTGFVSASAVRLATVPVAEADDATLARLRTVAGELGIWLVIGSLLVRTLDPDGRLANRCFLIGPDGTITARYDKIHLFDVDLGSGEIYSESARVRPGTQAVVAQAGGARLGLAICYDLRFPRLFRDLAQAGAQILSIPAAFTVPTGAAHWHALLRARAIETGCFVLAPAQTGTHRCSEGAERRSFGHSLAVAPWGEILADGGTKPGITLVEIDLGEVDRVRARMPSLGHDRSYSGPDA